MGSGEKHLIVNADDFGQSPGINRGIVEAYERGIVTSASLMVRWPAANEAAAYARAHPRLGLGLHVDLGEWAYRDENWSALYEVVETGDLTGVSTEVSSQLATFRRLIRREPTHIDSHQNVHLQEPVRSLLIQVAHRLHVPLRHLSRDVRYCGDFYGQSAEGMPIPGIITVKGLIEILERLAPGVTELSCHPGQGNDLETMYLHEREEEVKVLCDPRVRAAVAKKGITLVSHWGLPEAHQDS